MTEVNVARATADGFKLSKQEGLFFECLIEALRDHGVRPPKKLAPLADVRRVVDYDQVKLLMIARLPDPFDRTVEGRERRREQLKMALKRNREALIHCKIIGTSNPLIWYTGKPVRGFDFLPIRLPTSKH